MLSIGSKKPKEYSVAIPHNVSKEYLMTLKKICWYNKF